MGRKVTAFSDLSGAEVPEDELGRLVIRDHPDLDGPAVYLEALPNEVTALGKANVPMVTARDGRPTRVTSKPLIVPPMAPTTRATSAAVGIDRPD